MDILLVMPWDDSHKSYRNKFSSLLIYAPLTLTTLAALVPKDIDANVEICDEIAQTIHYDKKHYDVVGISFCTSSSNKAYEVAAEFRKRGSYVVMGGYHTTLMPQEALQHADTVIIGGGELSWPQFLYDFENGIPKREYNNRDISPDSFTVPRRELLNEKKYMKIKTIQVNTGCYNKCEYCSIGHMWKPCCRPIEKVIEEIRGLNTDRMLFFDPNFFQNKPYAIELMKEFAKLKIRWACNATASVAFDEELMQWAQKSGCVGVLLGLESFKKESLRGVKKNINDPNKYKEAIEIMHKHGISVNGCFVLGFDADTEEDLLSMPEQVEYLKLNLARFAILTPFPGTPLFEKLDKEERILTRDWSRYTQNQVIFQPQNMSPDRLREIYLKVWKDTYRYRSIFKRIASMPDTGMAVRLALFGGNIAFRHLGYHIKE